MVRALERGLTLADFEMMTLGMITGYIVTYNDCMHPEKEIETEREATQEDYDRF